MERAELAIYLGKNIRKYRLNADISQESLSLSAGLNPAYIGRLERGEKCPTIDTLFRICDALKISVCEILNFDDNVPSSKTEAIFRIQRAIEKLALPQQMGIAEIIENIVLLIEKN